MRGLADDEQSTSIISAVVTMAHALGLSALAEAVETPQELNMVRALGCDLAQGYRWARPLHPEEFTRRALVQIWAQALTPAQASAKM